MNTEELEKAYELRKKGAISEEEFIKIKEELLKKDSNKEEAERLPVANYSEGQLAVANSNINLCGWLMAVYSFLILILSLIEDSVGGDWPVALYWLPLLFIMFVERSLLKKYYGYNDNSVNLSPLWGFLLGIYGAVVWLFIRKNKITELNKDTMKAQAILGLISTIIYTLLVIVGLTMED